MTGLEQRIRDVVSDELDSHRGDLERLVAAEVASQVEAALDDLAGELVAARLNGAGEADRTGAVLPAAEVAADDVATLTVGPDPEPAPSPRSGPPAELERDAGSKRTCQKCLERKELSEFPLDRKSATGRRRVCKACRGRAT